MNFVLVFALLWSIVLHAVAGTQSDDPVGPDRKVVVQKGSVGKKRRMDDDIAVDGPNDDGASTAAFERPLRTDKRMSKKAIRTAGQGNGGSIEKDSKWVGSRNPESNGDSSTSRNSGSHRGSAAWNEGASLGHNDRGKCTAKKGPFLLNGWHQAGAAKACSRLFLWSVQGSGSTFAWQVLSAVAARADTLRASAQAGDHHDGTAAANATALSLSSPLPVKTEVVKGHYLNRMIKDNQLPMELMEGRFRNAQVALEAARVAAQGRPVPCLVATYRDFRDVLCSHARRGGDGSMGMCSGCNATTLEKNQAVVKMLGKLFSYGGQAAELKTLEQRGALLLRYEDFYDCPRLLIDTFAKWLGVDNLLKNRKLADSTDTRASQSAVSTPRDDSQSVESALLDSINSRRLRNRVSSSEEIPSESFEHQSSSIRRERSLLQHESDGDKPYNAVDLALASMKDRGVKDGASFHAHSTTGVAHIAGQEEGYWVWRSRVARETSRQSNGARAKLLRNFKVEDKDTKIHGNHLSNKGKIGGWTDCMTPAVSAHVHASLKPYLLHFNYSIPDDLALPGHTLSTESSTPAMSMPSSSLAAAAGFKRRSRSKRSEK